MIIIDTKTAERVFLDLNRGVTLNTNIITFFKALASALQHSDFAKRGVSVKASPDSDAIAIRTPHGDVVGSAEHIRDGNSIAGRVTFSVVRTGADDNQNVRAVMIVVMNHQGFITKVHDTPLGQVQSIEADFMYEVGMMVLARVQDTLDGAGATFFSI
ncbi:hypothetical protein [Burkholderia territorii]|uniref:hypothetical protein n=1 Tax=Burkholderia territorii TaxID=1503055 RepID=UPI0012D870E9|nr:hypothetical protein [Burkholderia territorii]